MKLRPVLLLSVWIVSLGVASPFARPVANSVLAKGAETPEIVLPGLPNIAEHSVARVWDETLLNAIRTDRPKPPVHSRNLFHLSVAM